MKFDKSMTLEQVRAEVKKEIRLNNKTMSSIAKKFPIKKNKK